MITNHTPGPWAIGGILQNSGALTVVAPGSKIVIADIHNAASFGDMLSGAIKRGGGQLRSSDCATQFANAHLIAAAPDLLELVKQFEKTVEYEIRKDKDDEGQRMKTITLNIIREAIALAEGRQP